MQGEHTVAARRRDGWKAILEEVVVVSLADWGRGNVICVRAD
jgi:hypothetical protein